MKISRIIFSLSFFLLLFPGKVFSHERDTSFVVDIRSDSTINERLYCIMGKLFFGVEQQKLSSYNQNDVLKKDTIGIKSWLFPNSQAIVAFDSKIKTLYIEKRNDQYRFSPLRKESVSTFWFHLADTKTFLPDSDFIYLEDAIINLHTTVLLRRLINITVNENFHNAFNRTETGIATLLKGSLLMGRAHAYQCVFDESETYLPNASYLQQKPHYSGLPRNWLFAIAQPIQMIRAAFIQQDESKVPNNIDPATGFVHSDWEINYPFYQFIFLTQTQNGKAENVGERNLFAWGPAKLSDDKKNPQWEFPFLMDYEESEIIFTSFQKQIIDDVIHGEYNKDVIWKYSDIIFSIDQKKDTAVTRILQLLWEESGKTGEHYGELLCFEDNEFRVKKSISSTQYSKGGINEALTGATDVEIKNPVPADAFAKICAIGVVENWYRTNNFSYETDFFINGFTPLFYDSVRHEYYPAFYWHDAQVKFVLGKKDYSTLINFFKTKIIRKNENLRVVDDSLLSTKDGKVFRPLNLFDTFRNGDVITCNYQLLHSTSKTDKDSDMIYLVSIGNTPEKHAARCHDLVPMNVGMHSFYFPGPMIEYELSPYRWGYCDRNGSFIIPPRYEAAFPFSENKGRVALMRWEKNSGIFLFSFIDSIGKELCDFKYEDARDFKNGFAAVMKNKKWSFVDENMKEISPFVFSEVRDFENGFAAVRDSTGWFFIDKNGVRICNISFVKATDFENGLARVAKTENRFTQWGILNAKGILVVPFTYDTIGPFVENLALVKDDSLFGFINSKGKISIPLKYSDAHSFNNGWCSAKQNEKWGFINKKQKVKIPFEYDNAGYFSEGYYSVKQNGKWGFVNARDSVMIAFQYDSITQMQHNCFLFYRSKNDVGWSVADLNGKEIIASHWWKVFITDSGFVSVSSAQYAAIVFYDSSGKNISNSHRTMLGALMQPQKFYLLKQNDAIFFADAQGKEFISYNP